jgi:steroid delta-isomerase-like uncharacterized protein
VLNYDPFKIAKAHLEVWNTRNTALLKELLAPTATVRFIFEKEEKPALKAYEENLKLWHEAFPDVRWEHLNIIPTAGALITEWVARGTHMGLFREIPPTGRKGEVRGTTVLKINEDGKIYKEVIYLDLGVILGNIGVIPPALEEKKLREIALAYVETYNKHEVEKLPTFLAPDARVVRPDGLVLAEMEAGQWLIRNMIAIPDLKFEVQQIGVRLNEVVLEGIFKGVHKYPVMDLPATDREVKCDACLIFNFVGEKIKELRFYSDQFTLLREIGVIPEKIVR